jgi:hypothetical protein
VANALSVGARREEEAAGEALTLALVVSESRGVTLRGAVGVMPVGRTEPLARGAEGEGVRVPRGGAGEGDAECEAAARVGVAAAGGEGVGGGEREEEIEGEGEAEDVCAASVGEGEVVTLRAGLALGVEEAVAVPPLALVGVALGVPAGAAGVALGNGEDVRESECGGVRERDAQALEEGEREASKEGEGVALLLPPPPPPLSLEGVAEGDTVAVAQAVAPALGLRVALLVIGTVGEAVGSTGVGVESAARLGVGAVLPVAEGVGEEQGVGVGVAA